jgi:hypothetical protein
MEIQNTKHESITLPLYISTYFFLALLKQKKDKMWERRRGCQEIYT